MTWIILQLLFSTVPFVATITLYKSKRRFMARFYDAMSRNVKVRKLYVQTWLVLLLLYHYIYTNGHIGEPGILPSTIVCAAMFSFRRVDKWLRYLLDRPRAFVIFSLAALAIGFVPHLHTLSVTAAFLLLAALFYPSRQVMTGQEYIARIIEWVEHPETFAEYYHGIITPDCHDKADSGNPVPSAQ